MNTTYQAAAFEIFRDVVNGPEASGPREIVAILEKHFPPKQPTRTLQELLDEQPPEDDEDEEPRSKGRVIFPII